MGEINDATSSFKILCVLQVKTTESQKNHKDNQQTILSLILPLPLFSLYTFYSKMSVPV